MAQYYFILLPYIVAVLIKIKSSSFYFKMSPFQSLFLFTTALFLVTVVFCFNLNLESQILVFVYGVE